ncbi:hypothetical protein ES703_100457 [subsurface metagenome]
MWIGEKRKTYTFEYLEPGIDIAQQAAESLLSILHKLPTYYDCEVRGMPHLRLLDTLDVTEPTANLLKTEMQVIKLVDNLRIGDYKTSLGLVLKEIPIIKAPAYWTPEWQEREIYSEATEEGSMEWAFNSKIIGYSFRLEWEVKLYHPYFPLIPGNSGADYNIEDLPYELIIRVSTKTGKLLDFGTLEINLNIATDTYVKINYKITLEKGWTWGYYETPDYRWPITARLTLRIACIPEFSYETVGPEALPHYPPTNDYTPPEDQPGNGYYYDTEFSWNGCKLIFAFGFNVDAILAAGFNTAGCYTAPSDALLDECLRKGLWLIPDLHVYFYDDAHINLSGAIDFVNRWKHHPAVAAWYFLDEPDLKSSKFNESAQQGWYNALKAADPNHDFLTAFTAHIEKHWNPNAFDHVCFDAYPYHKDTPNWEPRLRNSCNVCRSRSGRIGGMAVAQASYNGGSLNPTGIIDDMLRVFQEYGIGTQKDGYAMYAWGGHGTPPEDPALLAHVKATNASYAWPHLAPGRRSE